MQIARWLERRFEGAHRARHGIGVEAPGVEQRFGLRYAMRAQAGADDADVRAARLAVAVDVVEDRDSGEGKVAAPARKLLERPASLARPGRQAQVDNQLLVRELRRERAG